MKKNVGHSATLTSLITRSVKSVKYCPVKFTENTSNDFFRIQQISRFVLVKKITRFQMARSRLHLIAHCTAGGVDLFLILFALLLLTCAVFAHDGDMIFLDSQQQRYLLHSGHFEDFQGFWCLVPNHGFQIVQSTDEQSIRTINCDIRKFYGVFEQSPRNTSLILRWVFTIKTRCSLLYFFTVKQPKPQW